MVYGYAFDWQLGFVRPTGATSGAGLVQQGNNDRNDAHHLVLVDDDLDVQHLSFCGFAHDGPLGLSRAVCVRSILGVLRGNAVENASVKLVKRMPSITSMKLNLR